MAMLDTEETAGPNAGAKRRLPTMAKFWNMPFMKDLLISPSNKLLMGLTI